jgi:hypothetical protein
LIRREMFRPGASGVMMAKRDLNSRRVVTGSALPGSAGPVTCTSRRWPGATPEIWRRKPERLRQFDEDAALPLHRPVGHRAEDRARQGVSPSGSTASSSSRPSTISAAA